MSEVQFLFWAGWATFAFAAFFALPALLLMPSRTLRRFAARCPEREIWPTLSVIIAARDEESKIEATLERLLASDYPSLEIILANDRSRDRTGEIAAAISDQDSRLRVLTIESLPEGWLGKTHAMHVAAGQATGEYLLFTDGDIMFAPDALRQSLRYAEAEQLDHFCLMPAMETESWPECVLVSFFAMLFAFGTQPWFRRLRLPGAYYGVGAFNLVRRDTYERLGGHSPIRLDVLDDVKLGKLFFRNGASADYLVAEDAVTVRWQNSAWDVIRGLEKNAFAGVQYSIVRLLGFTLIFTAIFLVPWYAAAVLPLCLSVGFLATLGLLHATYARLSVTFGGSLLATPGLLPGSLGVLFAFWRSASLTLSQGGIRWRDTFYRLDELREGVYR
jgi:cellulose synthase/poly-beta-1,6-N-acetylglucosamine synthase-like glycosyltransferase